MPRTLSFSNARCAALIFAIVLASASTAHAAKLSVRVSVDRAQAFVNQQILVTREIRFQEPVFNVTGPALKVSGADIVTVDSSERSTGAGARRTTVRRTIYALFARNPGVVKIHPLRFQANLPSQRRAMGGSRAGLPKIKASSRAQQVTIESAPVSPDGQPALIADQVTLSQSWVRLAESGNGGQPDQWFSGQPRTRLITIVTQGQQASAVRPTEQVTSEGLRLYREPAQLADGISANGITGSRIESTVVVPSQSGQLSLAPIQVRWFQPESGQWQTTELPGESFQIASEKNPFGIHHALMALAAILAATCAYLLWRTRQLRAMLTNRTHQEPINVHETRDALRLLRQALKRAAHTSSDPSIEEQNWRTVRGRLIDWARQRWPQDGIRTIEQVRARAISGNQQDLATELERIDIFLYKRSDSSSAPDANAIRLGLKQLVKRKPVRQPEKAAGALVTLEKSTS